MDEIIIQFKFAIGQKVCLQDNLIKSSRDPFGSCSCSHALRVAQRMHVEVSTGTEASYFCRTIDGNQIQFNEWELVAIPDMEPMTIEQAG